MLAERKSKQRWTLNPRGTLWSSDSSKFGQKMLEKMGWSQGKGLGAKENGITEHIKMAYKNDSKGMGFKENNEVWMEHSSNFNSLLKSLSIEEAAKPQVISLEAKSQSSRVRVHYKKFTRGKDLSGRSEKDLANIFGKKTLDDVPVEKEEVETTKTVKSNQDYMFNRGSIVDYFKMKMKGKQNGLESNGKKHRKSDEDIGMCNPSFDPLTNDIQVDKHHLSVIQEEPARENGNVDIEDEISSIEMEVKSIEAETPKKKKKRKSLLNERSNNIEENILNDMTKKKKKKHCKSTESNYSLSIIEEEPLREESHVEDMDVENAIELEVKSISDIAESGSKKKKKNKSFIEEGINNPSFNLNIDDSEESTHKNNIDFNEEKRKKKKKNKINMEETSIGVQSEEELSTPKDKKKRKSTSDIEDSEKVSKKRKKEKSKFAVENPNFEDSFTTPSTPTKRSKKERSALDNPSFVESEDTSSNLANGQEFEVKRKKKSKNPEDIDISMDSSLKKSKDNLALENPSFNNEDVPNSLANGVEFEVKRKKSKKKNKETLALDNPTFEDNNTSVTDEISFDLVLNVTSTPTILKTDKTPKSSSRKSVRFNSVTQQRIIPGRDLERNNLNDLIDINNKVIQKASEDALSKKFDQLQAQVENDMNETKAHKKLTEDEGVVLKFKDVKFGRTPPYMMKNKSRAKGSYKHLIKNDILVCFNNTNLEEIKGYGNK